MSEPTIWKAKHPTMNNMLHPAHCWSYSLCWTCYCQGRIVNNPFVKMHPFVRDVAEAFI